MSNRESKGRYRVEGPPDRICAEYADSSVSLNVKILKADEEFSQSLVLLEGDAISLEFLGKLLLSASVDPDDCGFQILPNGPGSKFFDGRSELGVYIHRLPCLDPKRDQQEGE